MDAIRIDSDVLYVSILRTLIVSSTFGLKALAVWVVLKSYFVPNIFSIQIITLLYLHSQFRSMRTWELQICFYDGHRPVLPSCKNVPSIFTLLRMRIICNRSTLHGSYYSDFVARSATRGGDNE